MKQFTSLLILCFSFAQQIFCQSVIFPSGYGGSNNNGALVNYNLSNSSISTPISLDGNPLGFSQTWNEGFGDYYKNPTLNPDDENKENGLFAGSDGYVYGIDTRSGMLTSEDQGSAILYRFHPDSLKIEVLHTFTGNLNSITNGKIQAYNNSFSRPRLGMIEGSTGVLYGICIDGGAKNLGGIWKYNMMTKKYSEVDCFDKTTIGFNPTSPLFKGPNNDLYGIMRTKAVGQHDGDLYKVDLTNDTVVFVHDLSPGTGVLLGEPKGKVVYDQATNRIIGCRSTDVSPFHGGGFFVYEFNSNTSYNVSQIWMDYGVFGSFLSGVVRANDGAYYGVTDFDAGMGAGAIIKTSNPNPANCTMLKTYDFKRKPCGNSLLAIGSKIIGTYNLLGTTHFSDKSIWIYDVVTGSMVELGSEGNLAEGSRFLPQMAVIGNKVYIRYLGGAANYEGGIMVLDLTTLTFTNLFSTHSPNGKTPIGELLEIASNQFLGFSLSGGNFLNSNKNFSGTILKYDLTNNSVTKVTDIKSIKDSISYTGWTEYDGSPATLKAGGMVKASNNKVYFTYKTYQTGSPASLYFSELSTNVRFSELDLGTNQMKELLLLKNSEMVQPLEYVNGKMLLSKRDSVVVYNINTNMVEATYHTNDLMIDGFMSGKFTKASNGKIYGLTVQVTDTTGSRATIFALDPATNFSFTDLYKFDSIVLDANLSLTEYNGKLYGSTNSGGANNNGYIFALDISNDQFSIEYNFNSTIDGANFAAGWALGNNKLYSTSIAGGLNGYGTLVEYSPSGNTLSVLSNLTIKNCSAVYGTPFYSSTNLAIKDITESNDYKIYPNPAAQTITINHSQPYEKIEIFNVSGQIVYSSEYKMNYTVNTLNNGFYFVRIIKGDKSTIEKLVIQK